MFRLNEKRTDNMRIIGIDYGDARVGVAVSDPLGFTAQGVETVPNKVYKKMLERVVDIIRSYNAEKIVIGLPKNMNGTVGDRGEISKKFADELNSIFPETLSLNVPEIPTHEAELN